jgi:anaerobic magnesium-protoporphyrin IX monomethyl ester cyclase
MKKVLLLNPPGDKIYFRDYYRSKVSKANYYYHPLDLLYLSGRFSKSEFDLGVIDAIADHLSENACLQKIRQMSPDIILSLVASPSYQKDASFLKKLKNEIPNFILIATGDVYRELREETFKITPFIDVVLLDFSTDDIIRYLGSGRGEKINNIIYKFKDKIIIGDEIHGSGEFDVPPPKMGFISS